jgi:hypothetical protein
MATIAIQYCFQLSDERQEVFDLELDAKRLELVGDVPENLPEWTKLGFCQCPNCTLSIGTHPHCPVASHLADAVSRFGDILSYDQVRVDVITEERRISQETTAQIGIGSLMGLVMATSGCPHLAFFKPMARFHLPLANDEETTFRSVSMYLLGQYFVRKAGGHADFELDGLKNIYSNVKLINSRIVERLRTATETDSSLNAVITLDLFAEAVLFVIDESLEEIRYLFASHLTAS